MLQTFDLVDWNEVVSDHVQSQALTALESGQVIYLPKMVFELMPQEEIFLSTNYAKPQIKNISLDPANGILQGAICTKTEYIQLSQMMKRYAMYSQLLLNHLLPSYQSGLKQARTSFRPIEIAGRQAPSYRKDDTRLHVDAFPSTPTQGRRILRVFTNVNPNSKARVWRLGAPFSKVVEYFYPKLKAPLPGSAVLLNTLKVTKMRRTKYDHYMLQLHNSMKADLAYQQQVPQTEQHFPPGSTWIVYTDQVSHAAMSGQFTFEQTYYVSQESLADIEKSPCKILEKFLHQTLL